MFSRIQSISYYLPEIEVTNEDLAQEFNVQSQRIFRKTGVKKRYESIPTEIGSDVAFHAAERFFEEHKIDRGSIEFLLFCTQGTDHKAPASACILQDRLQLNKSIGALDFNLGCTGFIYGLSLAKGLVESGQVKNVLLLTSEVANKVIHPKDLELRSIFSDGAAATLIERSESKGIYGFKFGTDGSGAEHLKVHQSGSREPMTIDWLERNKEFGGMVWGTMEMNGLEIFHFSMREVPPLIDSVLEKEGLTMNDIDLFVFHQANGFLLKTLRRKMNIPESKFYMCLENIGNTVSSTIPIALYEAKKDGSVKPGQKALIAGFGIGLSWGATIIEL
jgi:3-oxoacyl-[acyl-carrier-protein] synthase-3